MSPRRPLLTQLDDYVTGHLPDDEASSFEEALFDAVASGGAASRDTPLDAAFFDELHRTLPFAGRFGVIGASVDSAVLTRLEREGHRVHYIECALEHTTVVHPWPDGIDLVLTRLDIDARGYDTLDVEVVRDHDGLLIKTFKDTGCDPLDGRIYALCEEPLARLSMLHQPFPVTCRVVAFRGGERLELGSFRTSPSSHAPSSHAPSSHAPGSGSPGP